MVDPVRNSGTSTADSRAPVDVSVIIPVYDDIDGLTVCVEALAAQELSASRFEVIVVDNDPRPGFGTRLGQISELLAAFPNATALHQPVAGSYAARNLGIEVAAGAVLAFTDADCVPESNWLVNGLDFLRRNRDASAGAGPIELFARDPQHPTGAELYELRHGFQVRRYIETASFGATANLFVRRSVIDEIGAFDASLRSGGDKEWGMRLKHRGGSMVYVPEASVRHPARRSFDDLRVKTKRVVGGDIVIRKRQGWTRLSWLRYSVQPLRPPLRTIWRARRDPVIRTRSDVLRYGVIFTRIRWTTALYRFKAFRGWSSAR